MGLYGISVYKISIVVKVKILNKMAYLIPYCVVLFAPGVVILQI